MFRFLLTSYFELIVIIGSHFLAEYMSLRPDGAMNYYYCYFISVLFFNFLFIMCFPNSWYEKIKEFDDYCKRRGTNHFPDSTWSIFSFIGASVIPTFTVGYHLIYMFLSVLGILSIMTGFFTVIYCIHLNDCKNLNGFLIYLEESVKNQSFKFNQPSLKNLPHSFYEGYDYAAAILDFSVGDKLVCYGILMSVELKEGEFNILFPAYKSYNADIYDKFPELKHMYPTKWILKSEFSANFFDSTSLIWGIDDNGNSYLIHPLCLRTGIDKNIYYPEKRNPYGCFNIPKHGTYSK